jgi:hypothetical protein
MSDHIWCLEYQPFHWTQYVRVAIDVMDFHTKLLQFWGKKYNQHTEMMWERRPFKQGYKFIPNAKQGKIKLLSDLLPKKYLPHISYYSAFLQWWLDSWVT